MRDKLIYLASPYTGDEENRAIQACRAGATLLSRGFNIYAPIPHTHWMAKYGDLPTEYEFYRNYNRFMLSRCDELWILCLDGWALSKGVLFETETAMELKIPIRHVYPDNLPMIPMKCALDITERSIAGNLLACGPFGYFMSFIGKLLSKPAHRDPEHRPKYHNQEDNL